MNILKGNKRKGFIIGLIASAVVIIIVVFYLKRNKGLSLAKPRKVYMINGHRIKNIKTEFISYKGFNRLARTFTMYLDNTNISVFEGAILVDDGTFLIEENNDWTLSDKNSVDPRTIIEVRKRVLSQI